MQLSPEASLRGCGLEVVRVPADHGQHDERFPAEAAVRAPQGVRHGADVLQDARPPRPQPLLRCRHLDLPLDSSSEAPDLGASLVSCPPGSAPKRAACRRSPGGRPSNLGGREACPGGQTYCARLFRTRTRRVRTTRSVSCETIVLGVNSNGSWTEVLTLYTKKAFPALRIAPNSAPIAVDIRVLGVEPISPATARVSSSAGRWILPRDALSTVAPRRLTSTQSCSGIPSFELVPGSARVLDSFGLSRKSGVSRAVVTLSRIVAVGW